jgi:AcrR family transcriptional regulator
VSTPRPRDSRATKELLLSAATAEFAEYGLAGARIDRIAERAGVNKRLIYVYFGDKDRLFDAVADEQAALVARAIPMPDGDLCAFAAARFDYMLANPEARRIAIWRAFERAEPTEAELSGFRARFEVVAAAQRAGRLRGDIPAVDLFAIVMRMTESWLSAPPALTAAGGPDPMSLGRLREHRRALLEAVWRVVQPAAS